MRKLFWLFIISCLIRCSEQVKKEETDNRTFVLNEDTSSSREQYAVADWMNEIGKKRVVPKDSTTYTFFAIKARNYIFDKRPTDALKYINRGAKVVKNKARYYLDKACVWALIPAKYANDSLFFYLDLAIKTSPKDPYYYFIRSRFLNEFRKNTQAINDINVAIKLNPLETAYVNQRGMYKVATGDFKNVVIDLKNTASANVKNIEFYKLQALAFNQADMHNEAIKAAERVIELDSTYAQAYVIRGSAFHYLKREKESIQDFYKASSLGDSIAIEYIKRKKKPK